MRSESPACSVEPLARTVRWRLAPTSRAPWAAAFDEAAWVANWQMGPHLFSILSDDERPRRQANLLRTVATLRFLLDTISSR